MSGKTWDELEEAELVRIRREPEEEDYFDVYGYGLCGCDSRRGALCEHDQATADLIERDGLWYQVAEFRLLNFMAWTRVDGVGMCIGEEESYTKDLQDEAVRMYHVTLETVRES